MDSICTSSRVFAIACKAVYMSFLYYVKYKLDLLQEFGLLAILKAKRYREYSLATNWDERFFESNRGRMVTLLRRSGRTVEELARALALTHNGVRAHLAILERDGIVRQRGSVRRGSGGGKPAYIYELTEEAEELFAKAYAPALGRLLDVLSEQLGSEESEALVRLVGRRLERVMNLGENRIEMRVPRSPWFPCDLRFPHS